MSKVKVDTIRPRLGSQIDVIGGLSANNEIIGSSLVGTTLSASGLIYGDGTNMSNTGKVLQVVQTTFKGTWSSSAAIARVGDLETSITPGAISSKILVEAVVNVGISSPTTLGAWVVRKIGSGSWEDDIAVGNASGNRSRVTSRTDPGNAAWMNQIIISFIDSPATTTEVTYSVALQGHNYSEWTVYVNRSHTDADSHLLDNSRCMSTVTLSELAG